MNEVAVISANMGSFETPVPHVDQSVPYDFHLFDDKNFPPRINAMTPRLQARIPKMFGWQMKPGYREYVWIDSSMSMARPDTIEWFEEQLGDADIAVFRHPHRSTVIEEADYLKERLAKNCSYITPRYEHELIDEQLAEVGNMPLYATTAFIYRPHFDIKDMMKEWWYHTSRFHIIDQLSFAYALKKNHCKVNIIQDNFMKLDYFTHTRNAKIL